jgi:kynureninase
MNPPDKDLKPREWTLLYSGLSGAGHIHSAKQLQNDDGDVYYDVVEKSALDAALKEIERLKDSYDQGFLKGSEVGDATARRFRDEANADLKRWQEERLEMFKQVNDLKSKLQAAEALIDRVHPLIGNIARHKLDGHDIEKLANAALSEIAAWRKENK